MSLILEALRKSEAERQLGRAPGLATPMPTYTRRARPWSPLALLSVGLGLLLAAMLVVFVWRVQPPLDVAATATTEAPETAAEPVATSSARTGVDAVAPARTVAAEPPTASATRPANAPAAPEPVRAAERPAPAPAPRDPEFDSVERESITVAPTQERAPLADTLPASPPQARVATPPAPSPPAAVNVPAEAAATLPPPSSPPAVEALPRLDQLGSTQRDSLPPLKQTMHVYAQTPADRFVLIDGRRYREGDRLATDLQVLEIRRDGTVFERDGQRFLLPRP